jgi:hypothetical protein
VAHPIRSLRRLVRSGPSDAPGPVVDALGRLGLLGYGVVHVLVAWLALQVAFGVPDVAPDAQGAVGTIAARPGGGLVLAIAVVGLLSFALWQVAAAVLGFRWVTGGERFRKRVGAVAKAAAMAGLAAMIINYLTGLGSDQPSTAATLAARLLALPAGRLLLALVAVVILVIAGAMTYTGLRRTFMGDLDVHRLGPITERLVELVGAVGHLARAAALAVVGVLVGAAALFADPDRAGGLDAALRALGSTPLGSSLLVVVAAGFASFGLFCFVDAATRRA